MGKRIEQKTSMTAQMTCMIRALSYYEKDAMYQSNDYIAPILLPSFLKLLSKLSIFRNIYRYLAPKGIYEYVIARTKYIDEVFEKNGDHFEQILIFGAGFDSRSIRFKKKLSNTVFFELDSPVTQNSKIKRFKEKGTDIPSNVIFIPINFQKETIAQKLAEYGFNREKRCLFLLEGLTMYLDAQSIDVTFELISDYAGRGSIIIFDYIHRSVIRHEDIYAGEKKISQMVSLFGEKWSFGIERGEVSDFLTRYGFFITDEADAMVLEKRYFTKNQLTHRVNETHSVVTAKK